jgi:hypothetical protein
MAGRTITRTQDLERIRFANEVLRNRRANAREAGRGVGDDTLSHRASGQPMDAATRCEPESWKQPVTRAGAGPAGWPPESDVWTLPRPRSGGAYTAEEVAGLLHVAPATVRGWISRGRRADGAISRLQSLRAPRGGIAPRRSGGSSRQSTESR